MADRRVGRAPIDSAILFIIIGALVILGRAPLFGIEWLYSGGSRLLTTAWSLSPVLCFMTIALAGGMVGHRLAMKEVADQLVRERWNRKCRSTPPEEQQEIRLKPVRLSISSSAQLPSSANRDQDG